MKKILLSLLCFGAALGIQAQTALPEGFSTPEKLTAKIKKASSVAPVAKRTAHKANYLVDDVAADGESMVYAFSPYDYERWSWTHSLVKFHTDKPHNQDMTQIKDFEDRKFDYWTPVITAQTFVDGKLWAAMKRPFDLGYYYSMGIYEVDINDGSYHSAGDGAYRWYNADSDDVEIYNKNYDPNKPYILDMSYDPTTGLLWYLAPELRGNACFDSTLRPYGWTIGYIDTKSNTPKPIELGSLPNISDTNLDAEVNVIANLVVDHGQLYAIACRIYDSGEIDEEGYAIYDVESKYVSITPNIDASTFELKIIRNYDADELYLTPPDIFGWSSLELDRDNDRLYLTYSSILDGNVYFCELNKTTGRIIKSELQGGTAFALNGLAIPAQNVKDGTPLNVTGLSVAAGVNGANNTTLTWTNPTGSYYARTTDPKIQGINIYRGDELLTTCEPDETSFIDFDVPYGLYKYTVAPFNAVGEGLREARTVFVGRDLPGAPGKVTLTANGATGTLTWDAPAAGLHGTWYDTTTLTYDIVRHPGDVTVATDLTATTFTETVTELQGYSYTVTAKNHEGTGLSATSNTVAFGPNHGIPYIVDMTTEEGFNTWEVVDHNQDGFKWDFGIYWTHAGEAGSCARYDATFCGNKPSDYLMSPVLDTQAGEEYKLEYKVMVHNYIDTEEDFGWYNGGADAYPGNGDLNLFETGHYTSAEGLKWYTRQGTFTATDDEQRVAFSVRSQPLMGLVYLGKVAIRHYSNCDLRAVAVNGSAIGSVSRALPYTVTVKNEGKKTVRNFKIRVYDEDKASVAEKEITEAIYPDDVIEFPIDWTPMKEGKTKVYAEVIIDGDTYEYDNITENPIAIDVTESTNGDWRTVGRDDYLGGGWCCINYPYSISQALYLADELKLNEGDLITGIGFMYVGNETLATFKNVEFEVNLGNTGLEMIYDWDAMVHDYSYYPYLLPSKYFPTNIFYGFADYSTTEGEGQLVFPCEEPFEYEGGNLLVQVVRTENTKICEDVPLFHFQRLGDSVNLDDIGDPNGRAMYRGGDATLPEGYRAFIPGNANNCIPVLSIGYTDIAGIKGVKTLGGDLTVNSRQGMLQLNQVCTDIVVTDLQGRTVARAPKADAVKIPANLQGSCIVTATLADGQTTTLKVAL